MRIDELKELLAAGNNQQENVEKLIAALLFTKGI